MIPRNRAKAIARTLLGISHGGDGLLSGDKILAILRILPREYATLGILREYYSMIERKIHRQRMEIGSPVAMDEDSIREIKGYFEEKFGQKFSVECALDRSLIAGIRVRAGDHVFEKSIANSLELLRALG
jgi:F0F1-type ATP synthase delta subunit